MKKSCIVVLLACLHQVSFAGDINLFREAVKFPDVKSGFLSDDRFMKAGRVISKDNLASMEVGMDKKQVAYLLGNPHFTTGIFSVREWNYVFNFKLIDDSAMVCQYQVKFDNDMLVSDSYFSSQSCVNESKTKVSFSYVTQSSVLP